MGLLGPLKWYYLEPRPKSVDLGSSAFRIGAAIEARNAEANALGSVTPARYIASTEAKAARRYELAIETSLSLVISSLSFLVVALVWMQLTWLCQPQRT